MRNASAVHLVLCCCFSLLLAASYGSTRGGPFSGGLRCGHCACVLPSYQVELCATRRTCPSVGSLENYTAAGKQKESRNRVQRRGSDIHIDLSRKAATPRIGALLSLIPLNLEPWKNGVTQEMVDRIYCENLQKTFRLQIIDSKMYIAGEMEGARDYNWLTKLLLLELAKRHKNLPDVDIVMSTAEGCPQPAEPFNGNSSLCGKAAPIFAFGREAGDTRCVLYPDFTFGPGGWPLAFLPSWEDFRWAWSMDDDHLVPWNTRFPKLLFRGAAIGNRRLLARDSEFVSANNVDFLLTNGTEGGQGGDRMTLQEHCKYRYLLHMSGGAWSARLKYLLLCGSLVLWPDDGWQDFWSHLLQDKRHVVMAAPVNSTTGGKDILRSLQWAKTSPRAAQAIGTAGQDVVLHLLTPETVYRYFLELLQQYAALQKFRPRLHLDAVPLALGATGPGGTHTVKTRDCRACGVARRLA